MSFNKVASIVPTCMLKMLLVSVLPPQEVTERNSQTCVSKIGNIMSDRHAYTYYNIPKIGHVLEYDYNWKDVSDAEF